MKKILIISSGFFFISFGAISQDDLEYKAVSDDPGKAMSRLYLGIEPIFFDVNGTNGFAMGWGAYAHYHIKQDLMFQARFQSPYYRGYLDGAYLSVDQKEDVRFNDYRPQKLIYADLTVSKKILRMDRPNRPVNIPLGNGGDLYNYIDGARAIKRYQLMARGGLLVRNSTVDLKQVTLPVDIWSNSKPYTNMKSTSIYAGVSINKMWELVANITELDIGEKIARMHKSVYLDLMYAPMMSFRDLEKAGHNAIPITDDMLGKSRVGMRFGVANMPEYKNNISGWEIGIFPSFTKKENKFSGGFFKFWWIIDVYSSDKT